MSLVILRFVAVCVCEYVSLLWEPVAPFFITTTHQTPCHPAPHLCLPNVLADVPVFWFFFFGSAQEEFHNKAYLMMKDLL